MGVFGQNRGFEAAGHKIGFIFAYFLFTTILYALLLLLKKLPYSWSYPHVAGITIGITLMGIMTRRLLR